MGKFQPSTVLSAFQRCAHGTEVESHLKAISGRGVYTSATHPSTSEASPSPIIDETRQRFPLMCLALMPGGVHIGGGEPAAGPAPCGLSAAVLHAGRCAALPTYPSHGLVAPSKVTRLRETHLVPLALILVPLCPSNRSRIRSCLGLYFGLYIEGVKLML